MTTINITHEIKRFHQHLARNPQTILSAKFGDGTANRLTGVVVV